MISLFIDTSSSDVSIAIVKDNIILGSINKSSIKEHSKHVATDIKTLLDNNSISPKEVNNIMVCVGPGSFTGIRIGVTIAKTYGYLVNNSLYPMSSLKELALSTKEKKEYIMSLISAKNNNYYIGLYDENYEEVVNEQFMNETNIIELIKEYNPTIVGDNIYTLGEYSTSKVDLDILSIINYYKNKRKVMSHELLPNYLKQPQALENKND